MAHQKIRAAALFVAILSIVLGISWVIVTAKLAQANAQQPQPTPKIATQADIRDAAITYITADYSTQQTLGSIRISYRVTGKELAKTAS